MEKINNINKENNIKPIIINLLYLLLIGFLFFYFESPQAVSFEEAITLEPIGFFQGIAHGYFFFFNGIISFVNDEYSIYAIYNNGNSYNCGFILGIMMIPLNNKIINHFK